MKLKSGGGEPSSVGSLPALANEHLKEQVLYEEILQVANKFAADSPGVSRLFLERLEEGLLTRDENPASHFCVYFLPFNSKKGKVFIVHHKKSRLWLSPGGHIDKGEELLTTLNREMDEELGVKGFFKEAPEPFLLTITPIENSTQPCKTHFDIWYLVNTDGSVFQINPREFHDTKWMTIDEAEKIVTDYANKKALEFLKKQTP